MPSEYTIYPERRLVSVAFIKRVTFIDIAEYIQTLGSDPRFDPCFSEIVDLRDVDEFQVNVDEALHIADVIDPFSLDSTRVFVAHTPVQVNAARMHAMLWYGKKKIRVAKTLEQAGAWVNK